MGVGGVVRPPARRKKKAVHKTSSTDDKRLQNTLKRLGVNTIPGIEEVNIFKDDSVIHFTNPKGAPGIAGSGFCCRGMKCGLGALRGPSPPLSAPLPARSASLDRGQHLRHQRAIADQECVELLGSRQPLIRGLARA